MRFPQIVVFERDRRIASTLDDFAKENRWPLREVRRTSTCLEVLQETPTNVLVLKVGRNLEQEMGLLDTVTTLYPDTSTIVIGEESHVPLARLAWDLGAAYVLFFPWPAGWLKEIIHGILSKAGES